jgi:hypothetical protein
MVLSSAPIDPAAAPVPNRSDNLGARHALVLC